MQTTFTDQSLCSNGLSRSAFKFISNHYFHLKTEGDYNYHIIVQIIRNLSIIEVSLVYAMLLLSIIYIIPKSYEILQKRSKFDLL